MKSSWCSLERALFSLALMRESVVCRDTGDRIFRLAKFRLPNSGDDFFKRVNAGCWYLGAPTTGELCALLRRLELSDSAHRLKFPGEQTPSAAGFLAVDSHTGISGRLKKLRLWWIDAGAPYAYRLVLRMKKTSRVPC